MECPCLFLTTTVCLKRFLVCITTLLQKHMSVKVVYFYFFFNKQDFNMASFKQPDITF